MPIDWWFSASHVSHPIFKGSAGTAGTSTARQSILDLAAKPRAKIWRVMPHFTSGIMVIYAYIYIIKVYIYNDVQPARNRYIMWVKWLVVCKLCIIKHGLFHILHWSYLGCTPKSTLETGLSYLICHSGGHSIWNHLRNYYELCRYIWLSCYTSDIFCERCWEIQPCQ